MRQVVLSLLIVSILSTVIAQDKGSIKPEMSDPRVPNLVDTNIAPIPGEDSLQIEQDSVKKALTERSEVPADSVGRKGIKGEKDSVVLEPINRGFSIGARWGFTTSETFNSWCDNQKSLKTYIDVLLKEMEFKYKSRWLREPESQSMSFPFTLGYFNRINELISITSGASYAFRRQRSVFNAIQDSTDIMLFEHSARLDHHQFELFTSLQYRFNPEYFTIKGVDASGIELGAGVIPLSLFTLKSESTEEIYDRETYTVGYGFSWSAGLFSERQISNGILTKFFFNYHGSYHRGFQNYDELFSMESPEHWKESTHTFVEGFFELGFLFTLSKSKTKDGDEES